MKYNNIIFLGLCLGLTTYSALSADSVIKNTGYYKNEGTAENIQIELRDDQDATLKNGDSKTVIVDEITRNAQFPLKARAITVNGNASQGTIEALINVIYTWQ